MTQEIVEDYGWAPVRDRALMCNEANLGCHTLVGSWLLVRDEDGLRQGLVVGEPQGGVYLVQWFDLVTGEKKCQTLHSVKGLIEANFFDTQMEVALALRTIQV